MYIRTINKGQICPNGKVGTSQPFGLGFSTPLGSKETTHFLALIGSTLHIDYDDLYSNLRMIKNGVLWNI